MTALQRAQALLDARHPDEARALLATHLAVEPEDWRGWCYLAQAHLELSDPTSARTVAERAMGIAPDEAWPARIHAVACIGVRRTRAALRSAERAHSIDPASWHTCDVLALALSSSGRRNRKRALDVARRAIEIAPDEAATHAREAMVLSRLNRSREAEDAMHRALALDPTDAGLRNDLGIIHLRSGKHHSALETLAAAIRDDPRSETTAYNFALVLRVIVWQSAVVCVIAAAQIRRASGDGNGNGNLTTGGQALAVAAGIGILGYLGITFVRALRPLTTPVRSAAIRSLRCQRPCMIAVGCITVAGLSYIVGGLLPSLGLAPIAIGVAAAWSAVLSLRVARATVRQPGGKVSAGTRGLGVFLIVLGAALTFGGIRSLIAGPPVTSGLVLSSLLLALVGLTLVGAGLRIGWPAANPFKRARRRPPG